MNAVRCTNCGTINSARRACCRDCESELADLSENQGEITTLGINVRVLAAALFALSALIPIAITAVLVFPAVILTAPIAVSAAAIWGFTFGAKIADVTISQSFGSVLLRGVGVAFFAFITFALLIYLVGAAFSGNISLAALGTVFAVTFVFGGWVALIVGGFAGYGLYRHSFVEDRKAWILQQTRINQKKYRFALWASASILSLVMIVLLGTSYIWFGKDAARKKLEGEVELASRQGRAESLDKALSDPHLDPHHIHKNGTSLLGVAIGSKNPDTLRVLLRHGADPNGIRGNGGSVLADATSEDDLEMMKILIAGGADVNMVGSGAPLPLPYRDHKASPLIFAAKNNNVQALDLLLENGADPNIRDRDGMTALGHVLKFRERILPNPDGSPSSLMQLNDEMVVSLKGRGAIE